MRIDTLGVVGSGAMGAGIAQVGLTSGMAVILYDLDAKALAKAKTSILERIARLVEKGQLNEGFTADAEARLTLAASIADFAPAQAVVEAIVERLEPKRALFAELEAVVAPDAVLATNTSSLSVAAIGATCTHKERVCGLHFFNPVPVMKLVEVIPTPNTNEATTAAMVEMVERFGKTSVLVKDGPGFLVNLQGRAYPTEALHIVGEGVADPATVDRIMRDAAGFRMGPFELMDLTGIDVNFQASTVIYERYQHDPRLKTTTLHELMNNAGRYGRKTGQGFHDYTGEPAPPPAAPAAVSSTEFRGRVAQEASGFDVLRADHGLIDDPAGVTLISPVGEDVATVAARLGLDTARTVAIDFTCLASRHVTVMASFGGAGAVKQVADWLKSRGLRVEIVGDSPGFVVQRILAMIANLGCEIAQIGVSTPEDVDVAMKLAQNYPRGPLEWADHLGPAHVHAVLTGLQGVTGSDRYRPSLWLRRRAQLNRSIYERD
jgi:3-hydroxybutyryl-CoA dehydrogenase